MKSKRKTRLNRQWRKRSFQRDIATEKSGRQGLKYEFCNLSVNSDLRQDGFSGVVSVEARLG